MTAAQISSCKFNRPKEIKMKNKKSLLLVHAFVLLSLLLAACSAAAMPTTNPAAQPPTTQAPTQATEVPTATLAPKPTATGPGGFPVGTFKPDHLLYTRYILFTAQGTVVLGLGDADTGSYTVNSDQIVFNMDVGVCHNHPGTYQWELHGNTLLLKPINETCTESSRSDDLGGRSWILQP